MGSPPLVLAVTMQYAAGPHVLAVLAVTMQYTAGPHVLAVLAVTMFEAITNEAHVIYPLTAEEMADTWHL